MEQLSTFSKFYPSYSCSCCYRCFTSTTGVQPVPQMTKKLLTKLTWSKIIILHLVPQFLPLYQHIIYKQNLLLATLFSGNRCGRSGDKRFFEICEKVWDITKTFWRKRLKKPLSKNFLNEFFHISMVEQVIVDSDSNLQLML